MSYLMNNRKALGLVLGIMMAVITLATTAAAVVMDLVKDPQPDETLQAPSSSEMEEAPSQPEPEQVPEQLPVVQPETQPEPEVIVFNTPDEMRGVWLVPGNDFLSSLSDSSTTIKKEIDEAISSAKKMMLNTIIIDSVWGDFVIYKTGSAASLTTDFDVMEYIIQKARENEMFVYSTFDVLKIRQGNGNAMSDKVDAAVLTEVYDNAKAFASTYDLDGVLLDNYYLTASATGNLYTSYLSAGGGMGFENYMYDSTESAMAAAVLGMHDGDRSVQVGLLSDSVWANSETNEAGSETSADFEALTDGYADTKAYIENGYYDFVAVKAFSSRKNTDVPFDTVVKWWAKITKAKEIPLYVMQASSKSVSTETGWTSPSELTEQVMEARKVDGYEGSMFDSLGRLKADPQGSTTALKKLFNEELDVEYFATKLEVNKPGKTTFTTYEPIVVFSGSSDPYFEALFNSEKLTRDENGYFSMELELKPGLNTYTFKHKDQTVTYNITRQVKVLETVSPQGNLTVNGGTEVTVTAMAYKDAAVTATLGGQTVTLKQDTADDDNTDKETNFVKFSGKFTMPAASAQAKSLGNVTITASWSGVSESAQGAHVTVNKKATISDGVLVQVTASQAETFPDDTLDDLSMPTYYPICKGSLDFVVGDELVYKQGSSTYTYYNLASGRRVYAKDITTVGGELEQNKITGLQVVSDSSHTYVKLKMSQKAAYTFNYSSGTISIKFHYTDEVPDDLSLSKNPLFSSAAWSGTTLKLKLKNGFLGYKAYYESSTGYLVFQCNNPPSSMGGARIVIDPGHCSTDPGALGFREDYNEYEVNLAISKYLKAELEAMGAYVYMNNVTNGFVELSTRLGNGKNADPHLLISVHANSAPNSSAAGTEAYYFNEFSSSLAAKASSATASALETNNRGAKFGRFYMTRDSEFPAILLETGFVSNQDEYYKLITTSYQKSIAASMASAVKSYLNAVGMGSSATGTQAVGDMSGAQQNVKVESIKLDSSKATLKVGEKLSLVATFTPEDATNKEIVWTSSNEKVAKVDENGTVTALKEGSATITAKTVDGEKTATCKITVKGTAVTVTLSKDKVSLYKGGSVTVTATATGGEEPFTYEWKSANTKVATVSSDGTITGKGIGVTTVTVTASNGATASCEVTVTAKNNGTDGSSSSGTGSSSGSSSKPESSSSSSDELQIVPSSEKVSVTMGGNRTLVYEVINGDPDLQVTFKSSNPDVVTVDGNGEIIGRGEGVATVTLTAEDGTTCTWQITVTKGINIWQ